jgi:RNA methyltransferase, TrmH family
MRPPIRLTSMDNPRIKQVLHLRKPRDRRKSGLLIAEGWREIERALQAGLTIHELFWSPELTRLQHQSLFQRLPALTATNAILIELPPALFEKIAYRENPEGLLATFEQPVWTLESLQIADRKSKIADAIYLIPVGTTKPGNLGAMARTAAAAGAAALLTADAEVDPFNSNAIRASTGAVFTLPVVSATSTQIIQYLRQNQVRIAAATPDADLIHTAADLTGPLAIVIGAEDAGLPPAWRSAAALLLRIPMHSTLVDSLNASTTAAILLYEARRQRSTH